MNILPFLILISLALVAQPASADSQGTGVWSYLKRVYNSQKTYSFSEAPIRHQKSSGTMIKLTCPADGSVTCRIRPAEGSDSKCDQVDMVTAPSSLRIEPGPSKDLTETATFSCGRTARSVLCFSAQDGCEIFEVKEGSLNDDAPTNTGSVE